MLAFYVEWLDWIMRELELKWIILRVVDLDWMMFFKWFYDCFLT